MLVIASLNSTSHTHLFTFKSLEQGLHLTCLSKLEDNSHFSTARLSLFAIRLLCSFELQLDHVILLQLLCQTTLG